MPIPRGENEVWGRRQRQDENLASSVEDHEAWEKFWLLGRPSWHPPLCPRTSAAGEGPSLSIRRGHPQSLALSGSKPASVWAAAATARGTHVWGAGHPPHA